jgi:hypothetical protein
MRGFRLVALSGAFIMAGCGDPATSSLSTGQEVLLVPETTEGYAAGIDDAFVMVPYGTKLRVVQGGRGVIKAVIQERK